ncbi:S-layer homology domain-containing protein [Paenibacillus sepulcri]|uniref:S-layer homology domain-containing protein n=1 Tax=Paenibacillus sepulcri TaxID=359917 RepID=UPI001AE9BB58
MGLRLLHKKISAVLVYAMILSIISTHYAFAAAESGGGTLSDINQSYAKAEITELVNRGIISGFSDGTFKPADSVTRAQLAKILSLSLNLEEDAAAAAGFKDVAASKWYAGYVGALVNSGISQGTSATSFSPDKTVTREELAVFFIRAFGWETAAKSLKLDESLSDLAKVSDWAQASVSFAYQIGFIKGIAGKDGSFRFNPSGIADRQALARLAFEFIVNKAAYADKALLLNPDKPEDTTTDETAPPKVKDDSGFVYWGPGSGNDGKPDGSNNGGDNGGDKDDDSDNGGDQGGDQGGDNGGDQDGDDDGDEPAAMDITAPGEYSLGNVTGDVTISSQDVVLKNTTVDGDLWLLGDIGSGNVTLDHVTVTGNTWVEGGGPNSIHVANSILATVFVNKSDGSIRLVLEDGTNVQQIQLDSGAILETTAAVGDIGPVDISRSIPHNAAVTLNGAFDSVMVHAEQIAITLAAGSTVGDLNVFEQALNTSFHLAEGSTVSHLIADAIVSFTGQGSVQSAQLNVDGISFDGLSGKPVIEADPTVISTTYTPAEFSLSAVGATRQIVLTGVKNDGNKDITSFAGWSSDDPSVAQVVYGDVKAVSDGITYIKADYGDFHIQVPVTVSVYKPGEAYPTLSSIHVTNGTINVDFNGDVADETAADFAVTAVLNGTDYELNNLQYTEGQFTFDPVDSYGSTLYITVESNADKTRFAGSQSDSVKLTGFGGHIKNVAGESVAGLDIIFRKGLDKTDGDIAGTATTDAYGNYFIYLQPGIYTGELGGEGTGYIKTYLIGVAAVNVKNTDEDQTAIGVPNASETRIVLTWGKDPHDLDSHLLGPTLDGGRFHTWYVEKEYEHEGETIVDLDLDDVSSYGPETTTIRRDINGTYKFYVHHFSGTSTLRASGARIEVFRGAVTEPTQVYTVPEGTGSEIYWIVFEMTIGENGQIAFEEVNELTNADPLTNPGT